MSAFKEKTVYKKYEWEYTGPDDDQWYFVIVESEGRRYVQFGQVNQDPITIDGPFLLDMADKYREITSRTARPNQPVKRSLHRPSIVNYRSGSPSVQGQSIEESVSESMSNIDESVTPVESFSSEWANTSARTGVDLDNLSAAPDTPAEWKTGQWREDALTRKNKGRPRFPTSGARGTNFKRVGAGDLI